MYSHFLIRNYDVIARATQHHVCILVVHKNFRWIHRRMKHRRHVISYPLFVKVREQGTRWRSVLVVFGLFAGDELWINVQNGVVFWYTIVGTHMRGYSTRINYSMPSETTLNFIHHRVWTVLKAYRHVIWLILTTTSVV